MAADPHRLRPDHHPTPFSTAEIHAAFVPGRIVKSLIVQAGVDPVVRVRRNVLADDDGGVYEFWTETRDGRRVGEPEQQRSTWLELQEHASMPIDATTIEPVLVDVPIGQFDGLRYTRVDGDSVATFWFALSMPGAPVKVEERIDDELVYSSIVIEEIPG